MDALSWDPAARPLVVVLCGATALFVVMIYRLQPVHLTRWVPLVSAKLEVSTQAAGVILRRCVGGLWLGVGALACEVAGGGAAGAGLRMPDVMAAAPWVAWPMLVLVPLLWRSAGGDEIRALHPEIRGAVWTPSLRVLSLGSWAVFLLGYEYMFRGALLFTLDAAMGAWPALGVTAAMYSLAHLHKPLLGETLGSIPMGILFGAMSLATGSFLPAFALHLVIAWTTELGASR